MNERSEHPDVPPTVALENGEEIDPRVAEIVDDFFAKQQKGATPDIDDIVAAHPDIADELRECLEGIQLVSQTQTKLTPQLEQLGDFRIIREVGRGGMGVVYEAEQISLKRRVALKVLRYMVADQEAMERFQREAETVASLHHSNIVPIYAVGQADGINYFAMQFIEGESLAEVQNCAEAPFEPLDVADWGLQAAEALSYAHGNDIIHRDVKPSNLIRDEEGRIWLTDFGLAKRLDDVELSMTGAILGTPRYMSPEQASSMSRPVDHRTDIYSLGATLYEFATGKPLFDAASPHAAIGKIINDDPVAPRVVRPGLPRDLETIIMRCVSKDVLLRYESADQLVADLRAFVDGKPIHSRRPSLTERFGRWLQKNQKTVSTATIAAGVAALSILGAYMMVTDYQEARITRANFTTLRRFSYPVVAQVLKQDESPAVPSFTLPTQHPVEIPNGEYELQLSTPGELSDRYRMQVPRKQGELFLQTRLRNRNLFDPLEIAGAWDVWNHDGRNDFVVFEKAGISLIDGSTAKSIWQVDLEENRQLQDATHGRDYSWRWFPRGATDHAQSKPARVESLSEACDFDGDQTQDLLIACRHMPLLMAISGKDGALLWINGEERDVRGPQSPWSRGTVWGEALQANIDDDDVDDFVVCLLSHDLVNGKTLCFLRGVSGADGSTIWQEEIDNQLLRQPKNPVNPIPFMTRWYPELGPRDFQCSDTSRRGRSGPVYVEPGSTAATFTSGELVPYPPQFVPGAKNEFMLCAGKSLLTMSTRTGEQQSKTKLSDIPIRAPQWMDTNQDGHPELLISTATPVKINQPDPLNPLTLTLHDLKTSQAIWTKTVKADWEWLLDIEEIVQQKREWPLIRDLDRDGNLEIVVPGRSTAGNHTWRLPRAACGRLQVLSASNGEVKWTSQPIVNAEGQLNDFVIVDDANGDQVADIAAVSVFGGPSPTERETRSYVFVDILSGSDGRPVKRMRSFDFEDRRDNIPAVHHVVANHGRIAVEARTRTDMENTPHRVLLFHTDSDRCAQSDGVKGSRFVDLDGGGVELVCWRANNRVDHRGGKLRAWRIDSPSGASWQSANRQFKAGIGDVDDDGIDDTIGHNSRYSLNRNAFQLRLVSGATGERIWIRELEERGYERQSAKELGQDFDSDGIDDIVIVEPQEFPTNTPLSIVSGKTGDMLWKIWSNAKVRWFNPSVSMVDLDNDGSNEFIVRAGACFESDPRSSDDWPKMLYCVDASGRILWSQQLLEATSANTRESFEELPIQFADLNEDGTKDILHYGADEDLAALLKAYDGKDGRRLWAAPLAGEQKTIDHSNAFPDYACVQNVVVSTTTQGNQLRGSGRDRQRLHIRAVSAESGKEIWEQKIPLGYIHRRRGNSDADRTGRPYPIVLRTKAGPRIGLWHNSEQRVEFSLFDPTVVDEANRVGGSFILKEWKDKQFESSFTENLQVWPIDLDGDDVDEIVYVSGESVVALSLQETNEIDRDISKDVIWEYPLDSQFIVHSFERTENDFELRLALYRGHDPDSKKLVAINQEGKVAWSHVGPIGWRNQSSQSIPGILRNTHGVPRILYCMDNDTTLCESASPGESYQMPVASRLVTTDASGEDLRSIRKMGLDASNMNGFFSHVPRSLLVVALPLLYLWRLFRRQWSLLVLMAAPIVAALFIVGARLPHGGYSPQSGMSEVPFNIYLSFVGFFIYLTMVIFAIVTFQSIRNRRWTTLVLLALAFAACVGCVVAIDLFASGYFTETSPVRLRWIPWSSLFLIGTIWTGGVVCVVLLFRKFVMTMVRWTRSPHDPAAV